MARNLFGGTADSVAEDATGARVPGATGTVWDGPSDAANQITDLTDATNSPITNLIADGNGYVGSFYGPDGAEIVWVDFGAGRVALVSVTVGDRFDAHTSATDPHGDRQYSDAALSGHVTATDPHGDRAYALAALTGALGFNVRDFGAKGDDSSVDSGAIQAAVNAALAAGGGTVYLPAGTYLCSGVYLGSNIRLIGAGMGATVLKLDPAAVPGTNAWVIRVANGSTAAASYVTVADMTIDGDKAAFPNPSGKVYGYYLGTQTVGLVTDCSVSRVEFRNCPTYALDIVNALRVAVTDCWSHDNGSTIGSYNSCSGFEILADDVTVSNCRAMSNSNNGFMSGESGVTHYRIRYIGCTAQANTGSGFYLHDGLTDSAIIGCASRDNGATGITLATGSTRNTVSASVCTGNANNGLRLDSAQYTTVNGCVLDGNATASSGNPEVYFVSGAAYNTVANCVVNSVKSSTSFVEADTSNWNSLRGNTANKPVTLVGSGSTSDANAFTQAVADARYSQLVEPVNVVAASGAALTLPSPTTYPVNDVTLSNACALTLPPATTGASLGLVVRQDASGSRAVTWPAGVKWAAGIAPTVTSTAGSVDVFSFLCVGSAWVGFVAGQDVR